MANKKISELTSRTPALSDLMLVGDPSSGYSYKCTITALATIIETDIADGFVTIGTTQTVSGAKTFSNNLTLTSVANTPTDPDKFLTLNASNVVTYRTGAEVLSDIGGASSSSISGTTNYVAKFTSSSAVGNSAIYSNTSGNVSIGNTNDAYKLDVSGTVRSTSNFAVNNGTVTGNYAIETAQVQIGSYSNHPFVLTTFNTERVRIDTSGNVTFSQIGNATTDTDKFLVSDGGVLKYRTGSEVLSDIGGQGSITLTTTGTSGAATLVGNTLNIPQYQAVLSGTGIVKSTAGTISYLTDNSTNWNSAYDNMIVSAAVTGTTTKTLTLTQQDSGTITASWTDDNSGTVTSVGLSAGTSGTDISVSGSPITSSGTITLNIPTASASNRGALSSADWTTFNNKQNAITLTTTGSSGSATFVSNTLNVPIYTLAGLGGISGSGTTNYIPKFTSSSAIGNSVIYESSSNIGIGTTSPAAKLDVNGTAYIRPAAGYNVLFQNSGTTLRMNYLNDAGSANISATYRATDFGWQDGSGNGVLTLNSSGNLGLSVTPSAWATLVGLDIVEGGGAISSNQGGLYLTENAYFNAGWKYKSSSISSALYSQVLGVHAWYIAPSGTAGNAISFTQAMTLDASGRLGIGSTAPYTKLELVGPATNYANSASIVFTDNVYTTDSRRWLVGNVATNYGSFNIASSTTSTGDPTTARFTITKDGNVGISTTSPAEKLDLQGTMNMNGASGTYLQVQYNGANRGYLGTANSVIASGSTGDLGLSATSNLVFGTGGSLTERMRITSGGNVGIGTTSPASLLHLYGSGNLLTIGETGANAKQTLIGHVTSGNGYTSIQSIYQDNAYTPIILNPSGGNVGIGTSSPASLLAVGGNPPEAGTISGVSASGGITLALSDNVNSSLYVRNTNGGAIIGTDGGGTIRFATNGNTNSEEKMRLTSSGELLLNTTSDAGDYKLQVNGNGRFVGDIVATVDLRLTRTGTSPAIVLEQSQVRLVDQSTGYATSMDVINGGLQFAGSIKTAAPSGGTAKPWKLGEAGVTLGGSNTSGVRVEIDGTVYYLVTGYLP